MDDHDEYVYVDMFLVDYPEARLSIGVDLSDRVSAWLKLAAQVQYNGRGNTLAGALRALDAEVGRQWYKADA